MKPTATLETITPEWAIKTLEEHEDELARGEYNQRPFSEATAQAYAVAMQNGHWLLNDQGIMFDAKGRLRNGRHRLWAVVMSGASVEMWVMRHCSDKVVNGLTVNVVDTVDVGRARNVAQQLSIDGVSNSHKLAAACRAIARVCCGFTNTKISVIQTRQILELYGAHMSKVMDGLHNNGRFCTGYLVGPLAMYRHFGAGNADQFCADYHSLQNLPPGSPVIALQKYIQINGGNGDGKSADATRAVALALCHYERATSINAIRHSDIGCQWLIEKQRAQCQKIRAIVGVDFRDHRK